MGYTSVQAPICSVHKWESERMNVLKPALQSTVKTLLSNEISQREINRKTGIDRKTIRRYARSYDLA